MDLEQPLYQPRPWHTKALAAIGVGLFAVGICAAPYVGAAVMRLAVARTDARAAAPQLDPVVPLSPRSVQDNFVITSWDSLRGSKPLPGSTVVRLVCNRPAHISPRS